MCQASGSQCDFYCISSQGFSTEHRSYSSNTPRAPHLSHEPLIDGELDGPGARVEHQVQVGDAGEQVGGRQVPQQVVDGVVEPAVHEDGQHDQDVGEDDEGADQQAQRHHHHIFGLPRLAEVLLAEAVEERHVLVVVANHGEARDWTGLTGGEGLHGVRGHSWRREPDLLRPRRDTEFVNHALMTTSTHTLQTSQENMKL